MYEYDDQQMKEEALQSSAAGVIQRRWREFAARREHEAAQRMEKPSVSIAAAAAAAAVAAKDDDAGETPMDNSQYLLNEYSRLLDARGAVVERSLACQRQLARYFAAQRQRKGEAPPQSVSPEAEQQYWTTVRQMHEEHCIAQAQKEESEALLAEIQARHQGTIDEALRQEDAFRQYIREFAEKSVFVRTNRRLTKEEIEEFLNREMDQRREIRNARIRNILLRHEVEKLQKTAAQREQQQDGMNLIDFEQLKIENTNLNEKIEERNEDLVKLRRKVTTTIHVLTHVKEKLEFMKVENAQLRRQVAATEEELNGVRDKLAQTKRRRDHFTNSNIKMREKMPMVGSEKLLLDYEKRKEASNIMRESVLESAAKHRELVAATNRQQLVLQNLQKSLALGSSVGLPPITAKAMTE
ncbi:uncharacterized protein TM35_000292400 [Trypanosoma theileri]|uniref:CCDC113/CCDC96 coiled-coil domain-containing protein n=1 Tax=Trypanosoma theileri TaxID=67003 RepID=A0A1X0NPB4_9TRYP|nr:uncharacterized protein TM35_000292400 [Trypanosoma theileri]ORC86358.1 hypothetical protein TM35_000292400 [Trypanosoma theileri]